MSDSNSASSSSEALPTASKSDALRPWNTIGSFSATDFGFVGLRWVVGALFCYTGLVKAMDPVGFLKLVHQYNLVEIPVLLNLIAAGLPWFEVFCGLLLLFGMAVRGTALLLVGMLIPFTFAVFHHALELHAAGNLPFCAIKFDCGCGTGEVFVCRKLVENALLIAASLLLVFRRQHRWCLWPGSSSCD